MGAEPIEHGAQVGFAHPGFGQELVEPKRAADDSAFPVEFRQRAEGLLDCQFPCRALGENLVGVARQRVHHAPDGVIGQPCEMASASGDGLLARAVPQPHQAMLQH